MESENVRLRKRYKEKEKEHRKDDVNLFRTVSK